jgi:hypothetical protein
VVHARNIGDRELTLIVSGKLWRNSMIMQDKETGTLWSHITGSGMEGPLEGRRLGTVPAVQTSWSEWLETHPGTTVLKKSVEVLESRYQAYFDDPDKNGMFRAFWLQEKMPGKTLIHGVTSGPHALAVTDARLAPGAVVNSTVGEQGVVLLRNADGGVRAWTRPGKGAETHLVKEVVDGPVTDRGTGSTWDLDTGVCIDGKLKGTQLEAMPVTLAYWFAWSGFYPNTAVLD